MEVDLHVSLHGESFSPALAESRTGLTLVEKIAVGSIGNTGKFRDKPIPYGAGTLRLHPPTDKLGPQLKQMLSMMEMHMSALRDCGADEFVMWIVVYARKDEQCNLELTPEELGRLSALGLPLAISYYAGE